MACLKKYRQFAFFCDVAKDRETASLLKVLKPSTYPLDTFHNENVRAWRMVARKELRARGEKV